MPAGMTKDELMKVSTFNTQFEINPSQEIDRLGVTLHFQKANSFSKCTTCIHLKIACQSIHLSTAERNEAKEHLKNHRENIMMDRRDYAVRKDLSLTSDKLLSLAHDGMSKEKTKFPHLLEHNSKKLPDAGRMMCSLNLAVVHKKSENADHQLHCFWNIDQICGSTSNATITQLLFAISNCKVIPNQIAIQLDNCGSNKCYNLIGAFGLLLLWIPKITKIYICTSEVGHTHNDVDREFGILAKALSNQEVYTPQGYKRFIEEKLNGIETNNLIPTTYDFESMVKSNVKQHGMLFDNHFFEISRSNDGEVYMKIAQFIRSQTFLKNDKNATCAFPLFKKTPDLKILPEIIKPKKLDEEKHTKMCNAIKGSIPKEAFDELKNLPQIVEKFPAHENFKNLLKRIENKVVAENPVITMPKDIDNKLLDQFLKSDTISKTWVAS